MQSAKQFILDIIEAPERHQDHAKRQVLTYIDRTSFSLFDVQFPSTYRSVGQFRYSAAVVMNLAYGRRTKSSDDPVVKAVTRCLTRLGNAVRPGYWKVDVYPLLKSAVIQLRLE